MLHVDLFCWCCRGTTSSTPGQGYQTGTDSYGSGNAGGFNVASYAGTGAGDNVQPGSGHHHHGHHNTGAGSNPNTGLKDNVHTGHHTGHHTGSSSSPNSGPRYTEPVGSGAVTGGESYRPTTGTGTVPFNVQF